MYTLIVAVAHFIREKRQIDFDKLRDNLEKFECNIPEDYKLAAKEAVNSTRARQLRNKYVSDIIESSIIP